MRGNNSFPRNRGFVGVASGASPRVVNLNEGFGRGVGGGRGGRGRGGGTDGGRLRPNVFLAMYVYNASLVEGIREVQDECVRRLPRLASHRDAAPVDKCHVSLLAARSVAQLEFLKAVF